MALCVQRAGLVRQAATVVAVAMCAYAVCSFYSGPSAPRSAVELVQKSHTKHLIHAAKAMNVSWGGNPAAVYAARCWQM